MILGDLGGRRPGGDVGLFLGNGGFQRGAVGLKFGLFRRCQFTPFGCQGPCRGFNRDVVLGDLGRRGPSGDVGLLLGDGGFQRGAVGLKFGLFRRCQLTPFGCQSTRRGFNRDVVLGDLGGRCPGGDVGLFPGDSGFQRSAVGLTFGLFRNRHFTQFSCQSARRSFNRDVILGDLGWRGPSGDVGLFLGDGGFQRGAVSLKFGLFRRRQFTPFGCQSARRSFNRDVVLGDLGRRGPGGDVGLFLSYGCLQRSAVGLKFGLFPRAQRQGAFGFFARLQGCALNFQRLGRRLHGRMILRQLGR